MNFIEQLDRIELSKTTRAIPSFKSGDTVKVHLAIKEGNKERIQIFEGLVLARAHGGTRETFTVRKVTQGVGVEKIFPIHSPVIKEIQVVRRGKVRQSRLYYLRRVSGKKARIQEVFVTKRELEAEAAAVAAKQAAIDAKIAAQSAKSAKPATPASSEASGETKSSS